MPTILLNWRTLLAISGIIIVTGTIFYSNYLAKEIAAEERKKVQQWADAQRFILNAPPGVDITFATEVIAEQKSIPVIETNESDSIISFVNIDTAGVKNLQLLLQKKLRSFKADNEPVIVKLSENPLLINYYYYSNSGLLQQVRYYPLIQLVIVALFIIITVVSITLRNKSTQNQVWAGMAKETAHQLGTPVSSLQAWVEMLKEQYPDEKIVQEMCKDVERLKLVSERFGKIGSKPQLEPVNLTHQISKMLQYMKRRAPEKVQFHFVAPEQENITANVSPQLLDWVIENLLKNALDAMEGQGHITVSIRQNGHHIIIDVTDTGKGIPKSGWNKVFKPGFTTKKRGWGLGLSLSRRIIEQYHRGQIFIKQSEVGRGTTFRILLRRPTA